jgi:hypothetical protein
MFGPGVLVWGTHGECQVRELFVSEHVRSKNEYGEAFRIRPIRIQASLNHRVWALTATDDIQNNWGSVASIAAKAATIAQYAAPGGFNDLDMMVCIGNMNMTSIANGQYEQQLGNGGLTQNEERAHFGLWAIAKSPIIMGTDMTKIAASTLNIIQNKVW